MSRRTESVNPGRARAEAVMRDVIALAAVPHPHPNPRVGAAVVSPSGEVIATAAHRAAGEPHAEVLALRAAGDRARGATMLVTLEPCDHHGKTPPCTDALVAAGIEEVIVGTIDPDPRVAGNGVAALRDRGIQVVTGVCEDEVVAMDPGYHHHRRTGLPLVTLKTAATLDGQIAATDGTSQWITSEAARRDAHVVRSRSDAVMVGAGTLRADDPLLTVRLDDHTGTQPTPVIVAGRQPLPAGAQLWDRHPLVYGTEDEVKIPSGEYVALPGADGVDVGAMIKDLGARGIVDLLVEGGPRLAGSLLAAGAVDRLLLYYGAVLAGGSGTSMIDGLWPTLDGAHPAQITDVRRVGPDVRITALLSKDGGA